MNHRSQMQLRRVTNGSIIDTHFTVSACTNRVSFLNVSVAIAWNRRVTQHRLEEAAEDVAYQSANPEWLEAGGGKFTIAPKILREAP